MKKLFTMLLAMLSCVASAYAQSFEVDGINYSVTSESPAEVTVTGASADITNLVIPESATSNGTKYAVTSITADAFQGKTNLITIDIAGSVKTIGGYAFQGCYNVKDVIFHEGLERMEDFSFESLNSLQALNLPNSLTYIGEWAFRNANTLTEIEFPDNITKICQYAFEWNRSLKKVYLPKNVQTLGACAFQNCPLQDVYCRASTPPTLGSSAFPSNATIHVVNTDVEVYKEAENWKDFSEISGDILYTDRCYAPKFSLENDLLTMSCMTEDATIYYTTDGSIPNENAVRYTSPIPYSTKQIVRAVAIAEGVENSAIRDFYDREQMENITDAQGVMYTLKVADDGSYYYSVTGHSDEMDVEIVIPEDLGGCPVRTIGDQAFSACSDLESIDIPNSVVTIGNQAFYACSSLESIIIPNSVTTIGTYAFCDCSSLSSITIPNSVTSLGNGAFRSCHGLTSLKIGNGISSIGDYTFAGCENLASVKMGKNVSSIGESAFCAYSEGSSLTSITLPDVLESIGNHAFERSALTSVIIPGSVKTIGDRAFAYNRHLTTAILGEGITEINEGMFIECNALTSVIIPDGVTSIGSQTFISCYSLTSIKLPESLTSIGNNAFMACNLKSIELPDAFTNIPENCFSGTDFQYIKLGNNVKSIGKNAFGSRELLLEIGTSAPPTIASDAFPNIEYLADINVIVPNAVAETAYRKAAVWQDMTFSNQNNVSEVTVETPGDLSFELITECNIQPAKVVGLKVNGTINADDFTQMLVNMKSLLRLDLSGCNITAIPDNALNGKTQLQELTLPTGLQTIGKNAFQGCTYLTGELNLPATLTSIGESAFVGTAYTSVNLPSTLQTIGNNAFNNLPIEQQLILPKKVSDVGASAFAGTKITGLEIPEGMTRIGDNAFAGTPIQGHVTIPDGITYLGKGAFRNTQVSTVFLPNSITTLSEGLFQDCPNLDIVYVPDNYTAISSSVFDGCSALTILRLSANLVSMGEYSFQRTPLEYIKVPSPVEVLSRGVLKDCKNLTSLSLPGNLKSVENEALYGCTALRNLSVEAIEPPVIKDRSAIRGINTDLCLISIPTQSYRKYVLAEYWGQFIQMRNDIAVETSGNGDIAFESVDEEEDIDEDGEVQPGDTHEAESEFATEEESKTHVNSGSSIYVPQQGKVRFYIIPAEGEKVLSATLDGEDIMPYIEDSVYIATADKKNAKLVVNFSEAGQGDTVLPGDVNDDGEVSVTDVGCVINYILEQIPEPFIYAAADMNSDDEISVTDVGYIINYILNDGASYSRAIRRATYSYGAPTLTADNNGYVLAMDGADAFIGFQMDVIVPGDAKGCNVQLKKTETGHQLACRRLSNGHYRMVCYSPVNETFSKGITDLLTIASEGDMAVRNIRFTTESLDEVRFADISATPTGIVNVVTDQKATDVEVYTLDGQLYRVVHARPGENLLKDLEPGIYLINKRKFIVR